MDNTRDLLLAAGMGLTIAQTPVLVAMSMYMPEPQVTLYTVQNGTTVESSAVAMGPWFLATSIMISLFAVVTHQLREQGMLDNMLEFSVESVQATGMWSLMLWGAFALCHAVVVMEVASPLSPEFLALMVCLYVYSISSLCTPHDRSQGDVMYLVLYLYVASQVHRAVHGVRMAAFVLQTAADLLLVLGHVYEPYTMMTVGNCRHLHVAICAVVLLMLYAKASSG